MAKGLEAYLERYGDPIIHRVDTTLLQTLERKRWCVVVPAMNESTDFFSQFALHSKASDTLVIAVINQPDKHPLPSEENRALWQDLGGGKSEWVISKKFPFGLLAIDAFTEGRSLPSDQGVGRARKIGGDIACLLWSKGYLGCPVVHSSDADAHIPENIFDYSDISEGALVYDFIHEPLENAIGRATREYECAIKYYRDGLEYAESPYAFCVLGSAIAVHMNTYSEVRGFPTRAAGEDFYLINKVIKTAPVRYIENVQITLRARASDRTPFGTGASVRRQLDREHHSSDFLYYNPAVFDEIRQFYVLVATSLHLITDIRELDVSNTMKAALYFIDTQRCYTHLKKQHLQGAGLIRQFHIWFDGLKILRVVNYLREHAYPDVPLAQCLAASEAWKTSDRALGISG